MDYKIVIPSLSRIDIIKERTLKTLEKYNIPKEKIFIFVVEEESDAYTKELHGDYNIIIGKKGIAEQRSFISNYFDNTDYLITLDDDIKNIFELTYTNEKKILKPITCFTTLIAEVYSILLKEMTTCCGIYPVKNAYFMSPGYSTNLKFCIGQLRFFINNQEIESSRTFKLLEDYEITLKYYLEDTKIIRLNNICLDADYGKLPGGLSSIANRKYLAKAKEVDEFYTNFSVYCFVKDRETKEGRKIDIGFRKKANALSIWDT
tara:strand:- start:1415 stop:2200 length:786 start_codon:yes stop_codon:yes gene_type:complete